MNEDECPHSPFLTRATCVQCNGREAQQRRNDREPWTVIPSGVILATFAGYCSGCGDPIEVGTDILGWYREGSSTVWTHPDCEPHR